jgi:ElaA protein
MFVAMDPAPALTSSPPRIALRWQWSRLPALSAPDLYAVLAARQQVFTVEQHCAFQDADGYDFDAWHLLGWATADASTSLATHLRMLIPVRICRVADRPR